jgi:hypothetical protein
MRTFFGFCLVVLAGAVAFAACGGGDGGGGDLNSLFNGEYRIHTIENEVSGDPRQVRFFDGTADGAGNASATLGTTTVNLSYNIATDRTMSLSDPLGVFETSYGIINADGSFLALTDAVRGGFSGSDVELSVAVAKSSMADTTGVPGTFILSRAGYSPAGSFYVNRVLVTINSDASTGSWEILAHTNPARIGSTGSLDIAFSTDGTFTVDPGTGLNYGIISPDRNVFAVADTTSADADGEKSIAVGVRISTGGTPDGIGDYVINQIGVNDPNTPAAEIYTSRVNLTTYTGTYDFEVTADSSGPAGASGSGIAYSVSADGTVDFPANTGMAGIVSPTGEVMVLVDSVPTPADDIHLGIAVKK